ncbi:MAG: recombinase RecT [Dehalococcoidia bacterium]|jgi:hypothetical protein
MPVYGEYKKLNRSRLDSRCRVCGGPLNIFKDDKGTFLACSNWTTTHHEGTTREASEYEMKGIAALNLETRREYMEAEHGVAKTQALEKYQGVLSLTKQEAYEILETIWPGAPPTEKNRAAMLCKSYQLNPLMKHVYLMPFKSKDGTTWATVLGIATTRLLAARRGAFSYCDDTPRVMTEDEQKKVFGNIDDTKLWAIVKVQDPKTGAVAVGYGFWPKGANVYGTEKGNTAFNMACIRAERQALGRLRPGEMPMDIPVMDEAEIDARQGVTIREETTHKAIEGEVVESTGEVIEEPVKEISPVTTADQDFDKLKRKETPKLLIDMGWLRESLETLNWADVKVWLNDMYQTPAKGKIADIVASLTETQQREFEKAIKERLELSGK